MAAVKSSANRFFLSSLEASVRKKKNRKKVKAAAPPPVSSPSQAPGGVLSVDSGYLCCAHHKVMVAGLTVLGMGTAQHKGVCVCGWGGGGGGCKDVMTTSDSSRL